MSGRRPTSRFTIDINVSHDTPVFVISAAAQLAGMHPQTLRHYDRLGLVSPGRSAGRGRRYSVRDIEALREVQRLSQEEGINLAGVKRILELENHVDALRRRLAEIDEQLTAAHALLAAAEARIQSSSRRDLVPLRDAPLLPWTTRDPHQLAQPHQEPPRGPLHGR
jgi:MerR family transcriptional regulator/heat shock protein HspR